MFKLNRNMNIKDIMIKIAKISDIYSKKHSINRDSDWYILKLQEECWELVQSYLSLTSRGRKRDKTDAEIRTEFANELADMLAHVLLAAKHNNIDIEEALERKWYKYL